MKTHSFSQLPRWVRIVSIGIGVPVFLGVMAAVAGCGAVSALQDYSIGLPDFYVGHSFDQNPVWFYDSFTDELFSSILPASLNSVKLSDMAAVRYAGDTVDTLFLVSTTAGTFSAVKIGAGSIAGSVAIPNAFGLAMDDSFAYVSSTSLNCVFVIDLNTFKIVASITLGTGTVPKGLVLTADSKKLYVADSGTGNVSVIDTASRTASSTLIKVGNGPTRLSTNAATDTIYVANTNGGSISIIDTTTDTVSSTVTGLSGVMSVGVTAAGDGFAGASGSSVHFYDGGTFAPTGSASLNASAQPSSLLMPSANSFISADTETNKVTVHLVPTDPNGSVVNQTYNVGFDPMCLTMTRTSTRSTPFK